MCVWMQPSSSFLWPPSPWWKWSSRASRHPLALPDVIQGKITSGWAKAPPYWRSWRRQESRVPKSFTELSVCGLPRLWRGKKKRESCAFSEKYSDNQTTAAQSNVLCYLMARLKCRTFRGKRNYGIMTLNYDFDSYGQRETAFKHKTKTVISTCTRERKNLCIHTRPIYT